MLGETTGEELNKYGSMSEKDKTMMGVEKDNTSKPKLATSWKDGKLGIWEDSEELHQQATEIYEKKRNIIIYEIEEIDLALSDVFERGGIIRFTEKGEENLQIAKSELSNLRKLLTKDEDELADATSSAVKKIIESNGIDTSATGGIDILDELKLAKGYFEQLKDSLTERYKLEK